MHAILVAIRTVGGHRSKLQTGAETGESLWSWVWQTRPWTRIGPTGLVGSVSDLCSSLLGPLAPHRQSPGSPPPAPGALLAQGEAEGAEGEEVRSLGLSAGSQAWKNSRAQAVR